MLIAPTVLKNYMTKEQKINKLATEFGINLFNAGFKMTRGGFEAVTYPLTKQEFAEIISKKTGIPCLFARDLTSLRFSMETGCPPAELQVMVSIIRGTFPGFPMRIVLSLSISILPLKGWIREVSFA